MPNLDFLPERILSQRVRRKRLVRQAYLVLVCAVALVALGYVRHCSIRSARGELAWLNERAVRVQHDLSLRSSLERQQAELAIIQRIDENLGSRVNALEVLAELCKLLPPNMAMSNLSLDAVPTTVTLESAARTPGERPSPAAQTKSKTFKRIRLVITGLAPGDVDVASFIAHLSASPVFEDINMGYSKNIEYDGRIAREFQASCYVAR